MYVSRMTRAENFLIRTFSKSKISKVFLETTFLHSSCHPDHYEPKIFFWFFEIHMFSIQILKSPPHPRYTILESRFPLVIVIRSRRAGLPYAIRVRKRGDSLSMYVSRMTRAENFLIRTFSKSKISKVFFWKPLFSTVHVNPDHNEPKIFYLVFRNSSVFNPNFEIPTVPLPRYTILESRSPDSIFEVQSRHTLRYTILDSRVPPCNEISEGRPLQLSFAAQARERELCLQRYVSRMTRIKNLKVF